MMSTAFHPQIKGQSKRTIQFLEDMLRACVLDLKGGSEERFPLVEFTYNNSYQASIQMHPMRLYIGGRVDLRFVERRWEKDPPRVRI